MPPFEKYSQRRIDQINHVQIGHLQIDYPQIDQIDPNLPSWGVSEGSA